ncbi:hypothetical protein CEUSTIGMA_g1284.t1 [Chlamydomonas eustigma]|uniref:Acetyltransferase component of pyruvate dehydrogenase complex n=1 Tax=Chlamydomonas eustigma TaxID=1157962 RepID=A0A250WSL7_9CHLO|nr:hypothetical protein CEUSTIGMA_g1284.t1 [Chlamydomonas eustigma]|eukprot:GAX73834.1 hypothetical protein CEUSTIGMA_g1284.t1 [Chlamydomonas eustigma]
MVQREAGRLACVIGRSLSRYRPAEPHVKQLALKKNSELTSSVHWCPHHGMLFSLSRAFASFPAHTMMSMPSLSPTMTQGNITKWKKAEGDQVSPGQVIAEVETDKATIDWEAQEDGYIAKLLVSDGTKDIAVGQPVAVLVEEKGDVAAFKSFSLAAASSAATPAAAAASAASTAPAAKSSTSTFPPHQVLNMPSLSPTMNQGNILDWKKKVGDPVAAGELYCDVETDKATMGWESQEDGFVAQLLLPSGSKDVVVGTPAIVIVEEKESVSAFAQYTASDALGGSKPSAPAAQATPASATTPSTAAAPAAPNTTAVAAPAGSRIKASPYAKKLAQEAGISLAGIAGTGPEGRIVAEDVQKAITSGKASPAGSVSAPAAAPTATSAVPVQVFSSVSTYIDIPHTQIRRVTAQRLLESKQTIPHYYLTVECQVDAMLKLREQINASGTGSKISVNDFVIKAASLALKKVPGVNSSWQKDFIRQYSNVDVSVAVQTPTGLLTPIIKDSDKKGLASISSDVKALAAKAKEGKLQPAEFMGGTFTISNLGMYGVKQFAAIVNPPQAAILAVGSVDKKVVLAKSGQFEQASALHVTLSCDHRVIDGAMGAEWLQAFRGYLENPYTMLL